MARACKVAQQYIQKVKSAVARNGYRSQQEVAEDLQISRATVNNFLNGKPVDYANFLEICRVLALEWREVAEMNLSVSPKESDRTFYVERPLLETRCRETLLQPGALLRIKAPYRMGKTCLTHKVLEQIAQQGYRTVYLSLGLAGQADFTTLDQFLQWFCFAIGQKLGLPHRLSDYWDDQFCTSKVNATTYFEEYLLAAAQPVVLCLDKVDRLFRYPEIAADFLGLLRVWYDQARLEEIWKRLRLVVVHSEEPSSLHSHQSPFNVGDLVELPEFNLDQISTLTKQYALELDHAQIHQLINLVGGHPYLIQQLFSHLKANPELTLNQMLQDAATDAGIYRDHLWELWQMVHADPQLVAVFKKVITVPSPLRLELQELKQSHKLYRMGLIERAGNGVVVRCQLYQLYFQDRFGGCE